MDPASIALRQARFGPFLFDFHTGELRKHKTKIKLVGQPLEVLALLLERPGSLVTRDELRQRLWPHDTVVDFDYGVNMAIYRLRQALGDDSETPRYIETLPRRGYRFVAKVELAEPSAVVTPEASESPAVQDAGVRTESPSQPSASPDAELLGQMIGRFRLLERLGGGGMGVVYRAEDTKLGRAVAIKFLPTELAKSQSALERFEREARAASALDHPNICALYDTGEHAGQPFLVMPLLKGQTLKQLLGAGQGTPSSARRSPLPSGTLVDLAVQIADGLSAAHSKGIIHRDIKPANVFVTESGQVKIMDFGLVKLVSEREESLLPEQCVQGLSPSKSNPQDSLTRTGIAVGTPAYMSPEQTRGQELDARSDLFSLGVTLYEMATGIQPFTGSTPEEVERAIATVSPARTDQLNKNVPPALHAIIARALEKDREVRYQSASKMGADLRRLKRDMEVQGSGGVTPVTLPAAAGVGLVPAPVRPRSAPLERRILVGAALILVALAIGGGLYIRSRQNNRRLTDKDTIVLSDFDNKTGDSVFDDTLKQGLSVQLVQSPFLALVSDEKVNETLKLMGRPAGDRLTPEVTREVCQRVGSKAMVTGSIAALGSQYVIGLKAVTCDSGDALAEAQEQAAGKEGGLKALDAAAISLRSKLGESLSSVQKYATPLEEATTSSLEALKAYSMGVKAYSAKGATASLPFFQRAADLDPNFAMAYERMMYAYFDLNEIGRASEYARKAYALREKVSERERFGIESNYYNFVTGELEKGAENSKLWQQTYPRDNLAYLNLGFISATLGNWGNALEEWQEAVRLEPNGALQNYLLGLAYMSFDRLDEAETVYKRAEDRKVESEALLQARYWLAFLKGDAVRMAQLASATIGKPGAEDLLLAMQADTEGWYGKQEHARELTGRATDLALRNNAKETAAGYQAEAALREVESGYQEQARAEAQAGLKLAPSRDVRAIAALALARAGDTEGAGKLAAGLDKDFPLDTLVQRYWLPTIRAAVSLERNDPNRAIELLQPASTIELSSITADLTIFLCPAYVRGEAYLTLHEGSRAAAEFQKFIDHRGVVMNFPWGALARLGLARAYAMEGNTARARAAYQDFLTIWKNADPDIPVSKEARAEYGKLK